MRGATFRGGTLLGIALVAAMLAVPVGAQTPLSATVSDVDDSGPIVSAVLTVDRAGRPVTGLLPGAVTVSDGGVDATVTGLDAAIDQDIPLALVLVIDTSGSMGADLGRVQAAASGLIERLVDGDVAAVISFASEVESVQPLTSDREALLAAVNSLVASGDTALYDAVSVASELASSSGLGRRAVVLLTDGEDFGEVSASAREESVAAAAESVAFYTISVGENVDAAYLGSLAERSGGRYFPAVAGDEIGELYSTIEELLRSQYVLTFERGELDGNPSRPLVVTVDVGGERVLARTTYASAPPIDVSTNLSELAETDDPKSSSDAPPATESEVQATAGDDGTSPAPYLLGLAVLLAGAGAALLWRIRRRRDASTKAPRPTLDSRPVERPAKPEPRRGSGTLILGGGEQGTRATVGVAPISLGSDAGCTLALDAAPGVAPLHARIWTRDGRVMLHHLEGGHDTLVNGRPVEWAVLSDGDEVSIGPHLIQYAADPSILSAPEDGEN